MNTSRLKIIVVLITGFTIFGCSSTNTKEQFSPFSKEKKHKAPKTSESYNNPFKKPIPPTWIDNTPNNDDLFIYGVGAGETFSKSINNALADMAQRLQVSVSANTSLQTISENKNISQRLIQQVSTTTAQISVPNYSIINQTNSNGTTYVELQVNIKETITTLHKIIKANLEESKLLLSSIENKNSLTRFNLTKKIDKNITKIKSSLRTLLILNPDTDIATYMYSLNNIDNQNLNIKRNINIYIDRNNSGYFYDTLKKHIFANGFNITKKQLSNLSLTLKLTDYDTSNKDYKYCINTKLELQIQDSLSKQLNTESYKIKTCSKKGRDNAITNACDEFYFQLNKNHE
ncbi:LPP20 family lipoprotein [Francisella adeliensis]|uniref:Lipoprotein LPP20-like domain-containing protein n=1 Tax=Francisella adeliensis TaxID=2007306 RepID=A0A2Z4XYZ3_9GAMM|nr:LPP20 family lipoprotein [Francisella adeliensis]AXA33653.1 hypothetical protein CDH04_04160 [Francisella adeliensis]MBK2085544.1 LPP20 family lipoprotein [Francisella adeliensis]MBK2097422.1 LPP20 family lipoprotein [Francisella adeliensis]QIW11887.1 hypothetical protein FZC43_04165 [Francisella adeliensis]QIW13763.1 hypothetical protein FZC44_04165 [Francisella adeliensis]